jgi:hypothetical protein
MALSMFVLGDQAVAVSDNEPLVEERFETDLGVWSLVGSDSIEIIAEPETQDNHVLQLTPQRGKYAHAIFSLSEEWSDIRIEGKFLFPTDGDGYLGFIYNYQNKDGRKDFGCIYVKSNGNYIRVSPHHDGNPSWRLYEELKVYLTGAQRIEVGKWYRFRLDVLAHRASLYLVDMETPVRTFDWIQRSGAFGFEARPGGGEPVWVDDVVVTRLARQIPEDPDQAVAVESGAAGTLLTTWEVQGPFDEDDRELESPRLDNLVEAEWHSKRTDERGAVITALDSDFNVTPKNVLYLRTAFSSPESSARVLTVSTANKLDIWLNDDYVGAIEPDSYIWSDFLSNPEHSGSRLTLEVRKGPNRLVFRVDGSRFAGGGLFAALILGQE